MWQQAMNFIDCETRETIIRKLKCLIELRFSKSSPTPLIISSPNFISL